MTSVSSIARADVSGTQIVHIERLASGVHLVVARDDSLPVAALAFVLDRGTRDDPGPLPGLVHALAYHLQMGNRTLRPGAALAESLDAGGVARMAVGPAQIRFTSLFPVNSLKRAIWIEARRLRAPTIKTDVWLEALAHARDDDGAGRTAPVALMAIAWSDPALSHFGHGVSEELASLPTGVIGQHLARSLEYPSASIIIVTPGDGAAAREWARREFADLPTRDALPVAPDLKQLRPLPPRQTGESTPAIDSVEFPGIPANLFVWPVPADAASRLWARVLCTTFDRMPRNKAAVHVRARCHYQDDPHRPTLILHVRGSDQVLGEALAAAGPSTPHGSRAESLAGRALIARLDAMALGREYHEIKRALAEVRQWSQRTRFQPLELATRLATHPVDLRHRLVDSAGPLVVDVDELLGERALAAGPRAITDVLAGPLDPRRIVAIVRPGSRSQAAAIAQPAPNESSTGDASTPGASRDNAASPELQSPGVTSPSGDAAQPTLAPPRAPAATPPSPQAPKRSDAPQ